MTRRCACRHSWPWPTTIAVRCDKREKMHALAVCKATIGHSHRASQENGTGARAIACPFGKVDTDRHVKNNSRDADAGRLGLEFVLHSDEYDPDADHIGLQASEALGIAPQRMLKTLMAEVDGNPVCVVVPSDREVSMKKLAAAFGGKAAKMMRPADAERVSCRRHQPEVSINPNE